MITQGKARFYVSVSRLPEPKIFFLPVWHVMCSLEGSAKSLSKRQFCTRLSALLTNSLVGKTRSRHHLPGASNMIARSAPAGRAFVTSSE
jgi:hypothetical protein